MKVLTTVVLAAVLLALASAKGGHHGKGGRHGGKGHRGKHGGRKDCGKKKCFEAAHSWSKCKGLVEKGTCAFLQTEQGGVCIPGKRKEHGGKRGKHGKHGKPGKHGKHGKHGKPGKHGKHGHHGPPKHKQHG